MTINYQDAFDARCKDKSEIILAQFRMYDVDENGMIDLNEMTKLVRSIFKVSNQSQVTLEKKNSDKIPEEISQTVVFKKTLSFPKKYCLIFCQKLENPQK